MPSDTGELQKKHRSELTDIRHLRWYFFSYPPPVPQKGSTQRQTLPSLNGVLNSCIWVKFLNPLTQKIKAFLCKWCKRIEIISIEILPKNKVVHSYAVIVVLTHTVAQRPKVTQVYPVCCAALYPAEQDNGSPQIVPHMVVIVQDTFAQIVNIQILFFSVLDYLTEEEWNILQVIPFDVVSWFHNVLFAFFFPYFPLFTEHLLKHFT
ncbi:hypothetical protein M101_5009 [Bacteroides fragilis str. 1007-1-F |nr:hypothetical protein M101_5009 [Bacteroides fragilis str. 1007-1-F \